MKTLTAFLFLALGFALSAQAQTNSTIASQILKHDGPQLVISMPNDAAMIFLKQQFASGTPFVISKPLSGGNSGLQLSGWMTIASVRVIAMDPAHGSATVTIVEELSPMSVNGQAVDHFAPQTELRLTAE